MAVVSYEQMIRDILDVLPMQLRERLLENEPPSRFEDDELKDMVEVLRDYMGFIRTSLTRTKEQYAELERHARILRAENQILSSRAGNPDEWELLVDKMVKYIEELTESQREDVFKAMGGERIHTPYGTLLLVRPFLLREKERG